MYVKAGGHRSTLGSISGFVSGCMRVGVGGGRMCVGCVFESEVNLRCPLEHAPSLLKQGLSF